MRYDSARELIGQFYEFEELGKNSCQIVINKYLDQGNLYFIALKEFGDTCFLTDYAKVCEMVEISEQELKHTAINFGLNFDNFYIKKEFNDIEDLQNFIMFFDYISENYTD